MNTSNVVLRVIILSWWQCKFSHLSWSANRLCFTRPSHLTFAFVVFRIANHVCDQEKTLYTFNIMSSPQLQTKAALCVCGWGRGGRLNFKLTLLTPCQFMNHLTLQLLHMDLRQIFRTHMAVFVIYLSNISPLFCDWHAKWKKKFAKSRLSFLVYAAMAFKENKMCLQEEHYGKGLSNFYFVSEKNIMAQTLLLVIKM